MKVIICGCARNIVNFWTNTSKNLQIIFDSLEDYKCIIIESNSTDNSLDILNNWSKNNPKIKRYSCMIDTKSIVTPDLLIKQTIKSYQNAPHDEIYLNLPYFSTFRNFWT
jgi:hypothetical protein